MLVLTRGIGEEIVIDGNIQITVVSIQGNKVRLGIKAPPDVVVDRREIHERRKEFDLVGHYSEPALVVADRPRHRLFPGRDS